MIEYELILHIMEFEQKKRKSLRPKDFDAFLKVVIVGQSGVGKSSIMLRFTDDKFNETYVNTIGVDFRFRTLCHQDKKVKIQIWDTAGQEKFRTMTSTYYRGADAILLVYDITNKKSYEEIMGYWTKEVETQGSECPFLIIVGNKADLEGARQVPKPAAELTKMKLGDTVRMAKTIETSAKTSSNVMKLFEELTQDYLLLKKSLKAGGSSEHFTQTLKAVKSGKKKEEGCSC